MTSEVFRPYPGQPLPRAPVALFPAGGGVVPVRGPAVASTAWWPESWTPMPFCGLAALIAPVAAFQPAPAMARTMPQDYPIQGPLLEAVAPIVTPAGAAYVFAGSRPVPGTAASFRSEDRTAQPISGAVALLDDTVLVVVADAIPHPQAFDRTVYTWPVLPTYLAAIATPLAAPYMFGGVPVLGALERRESPAQLAPMPAIQSPPLSLVPRGGIASIPGAGDYPTQEPLLEPVAPFTTTAGPTYAFTGLPFIRASTQRPAEDRATQPVAGSAALLDDTVLVVVADAIPHPQAFERTVYTWPVLPTYLAAIATPAGTPAPINPTPLAFWTRDAGAGLQLSIPGAALLGAQQTATYVPPPSILRADRVELPFIQPVRLLAAVLTPGAAIQLAPGETISPTAYEPRITITFDDRRIYPTRLH